MKSFNTMNNVKAIEAPWLYEQEKKQARKQDKQLRKMKQGRKGMWATVE